MIVGDVAKHGPNLTRISEAHVYAGPTCRAKLHHLVVLDLATRIIAEKAGVTRLGTSRPEEIRNMADPLLKDRSDEP